MTTNMTKWAQVEEDGAKQKLDETDKNEAIVHQLTQNIHL